MLGLTGRTPYVSSCAHWVRGRRCALYITKRHLFEYSPRTKNTPWNLSIKEEEDTHKEYNNLPWKGVWSESPAANLVHLWFNKNYSHAIDYFKTLREFGPQPDTRTYNLFFSLLEDVGSPQEVIDYYGDFAVDNAERVEAKPDALTFAYVIKAYAVLGDFDGAIAALADCKQRGLTPTSRTYAVLLDLCTDHKKRDQGEQIIVEAEAMYKNVDSWYERELILGGTPQPVSETPVETEEKGSDEKKEVRLDDGEPEDDDFVADIEFINAKLYFYGVEDSAQAERVFDEDILTKLIPSYNTYQRLIEVYAAHGNSAAVAKTAELMRERGFTLNDQKTKYTLMECFVKTADPRVLNAIQNSYKREHYRNDPYCVFYVDWLKKYRAGGGPLPIADELLEKGTRKQLAEAFVSCLFQETSGVERSNVTLTGIQDSIPVPRDPRSIITSDIKESAQTAPVPTSGDPLVNYRKHLQEQGNASLQDEDEVTLRRKKEKFEKEGVIGGGAESQIDNFARDLEADQSVAQENFESVRSDIRTRLIEMELTELEELGIDVNRLSNFPNIYSVETPVIQTPPYVTIDKDMEEQLIKEVKELAVNAGNKTESAIAEAEAEAEVDDYLLEGEEMEQTTDAVKEGENELNLEEGDDLDLQEAPSDKHIYDTPFGTEEDVKDPFADNIIEDAERIAVEKEMAGEQVGNELSEVLPPETQYAGLTLTDHFYVAAGEKDYKNHEDIVRGLRLEKLREKMRAEIARLREKESKQGTPPVPVAQLTSPALDYLRESYVKARTEEIDVHEVANFTRGFDSIVDTLEITQPDVYKQLYAQYLREVRGQNVPTEANIDEASPEDIFKSQLQGIDQLVNWPAESPQRYTQTKGLLEALAERDSRKASRVARSATSRIPKPPTPFETE